jgi:bla regulator protein BlaR1
MQHLFQSTFLQALGYAIANSLWQMALIWLVYMSITGLTSMGAAARYRLAVAAQVTGFIWFIVTFQFYYGQYTDALQHSGAVSGNIQTILSPGTDLSSRLINWMVKGEQLLPYVSMAYLLLMVFLCIRWFLGYRQTQLMRNSGLQKMPAEWRLFVDKIAMQLQIKQKIRLFLSDKVTTPLTIGFLKPVILIPVASLNHLTTDQLEAVLLHEMAHIKRYDYLVNIILSVVEISLFFNPFTQLLSKNICKERENSCDDWVLQFQYDASVYAAALLRIAYLQTAPVFAMAASGKKNELLIRVKRMIDKKDNRFNYRRQLLAFVIVTGILSSIAWLNPITTPGAEKQDIENKDTEQVTRIRVEKKIRTYSVEPMAVNVDNPLFNPIFFLAKPLKAEIKKNITSIQKEAGDAALEPISVFSMVTDALEQAPMATKLLHSDWKKEMADIKNVQPEFSKILYSDSGLFSVKMRRQFQDEVNSSIKKVESSLKKTTADIAEIDKAKAKIEPCLNTDAMAGINKIQADIQKVMQSVEIINNTGLDKLVFTTLGIADLFNSDDRSQQKMKSHKISSWEENGKTRIRISTPDKEPASLQKTEELDELKKGEDISVGLSAVPIRSISLADLQRLKNDLSTVVRIEKVSIKHSQDKIRIVVGNNKEKAEEPNVAARLQ